MRLEMVITMESQLQPVPEGMRLEMVITMEIRIRNDRSRFNQKFHLTSFPIPISIPTTISLGGGDFEI